MRLALILCLLLLFAAPVQADMPPSLPHSVYGDVIGSGLGARIEVRNAQGTPYARTTPLYYRATLVYSLDLPATYDSVPGGTEGEVLRFYVDLLLAATSHWQSGSHSRLNLYPEGGGTATPTSTETAQLRLLVVAPGSGGEGQDRSQAELTISIGEGSVTLYVSAEDIVPMLRILLRAFLEGVP